MLGPLGRWLFGATIVGAFLLLSPAGSAYVRILPPDENYLTGFLVMRDGRALVSWDQRSVSDDNVDRGSNGVGAADEWTSEPVPRMLYLNVSRPIQAVLFAEGNKEIRVELVIRADDALLTGGTFSNTDILYCGEPFSETAPCAEAHLEPRAEGYTGVQFGMQAELDTIAKGTILHFRVVHRSSDVLKYGLADGHRSVLQIPLFSPDEVLYRIPKYQQGEPNRGPATIPAMDPVSDLLKRLPIGLVAPLGLASRGMGARRRAAPWIAALLLAAALAGCAGRPSGAADHPPASTGPGLGGTAEVYVVRDDANETGLANGSRGGILGVVSDPDEMPVNGAYAILVGTDRSVATNPYGRFQFLGLAPGEYDLRVDRSGFLSFETRVRVAAASITKVEIVLQFPASVEAAERPHRHDYWFDRETGAPVESMTIYEVDDFVSVLPPPLIVPPGTADLEITMTWPNAVDGGLVVAPPNDPARLNDTRLYPRPSGTPFHIRTTWEMTDSGHATYTAWGHFGATGSGLGCGQVDYRLAQVGLKDCGTHLKITAHKGVVPLEPPHPDHWVVGDTLTIIESEKQSLRGWCSSTGGQHCPTGYHVMQNSGCMLSQPFYLPSTPPPCHDFVEQRPYNATWQPKGFVPFEAQWVEAKIVASRHQAPQDSSDAPWILVVRDAKTTNYGDCSPKAYTGSTTRPGDLHYYNEESGRRATLVDRKPASLTWTWWVPLETGSADPPYARRTQWCFYIAPSDQQAELVDDYQATAVGAGFPSFELTVTAHRDPMPRP